MSYSNIESFVGCYSDQQRPEKRQKLGGSCLKEKRLLPSLKILDLSFCEQLCSLGDFDQLPSLERLIVRNCINLVEVCESIEECVELVFIDLSYCNKLEKLPRNLGMLKKVKTLLLDMDSCNLKNKDMGSQELCRVSIPRDLKLFATSLPRSLVRLSLANNNLCTESFPMDFSCLSMLKRLDLDLNPIVSMPSCVRTLPRLEKLSMKGCNKLKSVEHPPRTLRKLLLYSAVLEKVVFDPEMSPLDLADTSNLLSPRMYEIQGVRKFQRMKDVEEKVLCSLGWADLDFLKKSRMQNYPQESEIKMFYEFGIFSIMYEEEEMPSWFRHRSVGPSISFTIPSSPFKLRGLNFCSLHTSHSPLRCWPPDDYYPNTPMMTISNVTKNHMWIYERYRKWFDENYCWVMLSHWMFGRNEMEAGDRITITVTDSQFTDELTKECGVSLVYEEEEDDDDALGYYKSWNHIIGGDLSHFQTTTGEYLLDGSRFSQSAIRLRPYHRKFIPDGPDVQEKEEPWFRALSPRKPDVM